MAEEVPVDIVTDINEGNKIKMYFSSLLSYYSNKC